MKTTFRLWGKRVEEFKARRKISSCHTCQNRLMNDNSIIISLGSAIAFTRMYMYPLHIISFEKTTCNLLRFIYFVFRTFLDNVCRE